MKLRYKIHLSVLTVLFIAIIMFSGGHIFVRFSAFFLFTLLYGCSFLTLEFFWFKGKYYVQNSRLKRFFLIWIIPIVCLILVLDQIHAFYFERSINEIIYQTQQRMTHEQELKYYVRQRGYGLYEDVYFERTLLKIENITFQIDSRHGLLWLVLGTDAIGVWVCKISEAFIPTIHFRNQRSCAGWYADFGYSVSEKNGHISKHGRFLWSPRNLEFSPYAGEG